MDGRCSWCSLHASWVSRVRHGEARICGGGLCGWMQEKSALRSKTRRCQQPGRRNCREQRAANSLAVWTVQVSRPEMGVDAWLGPALEEVHRPTVTATRLAIFRVLPQLGPGTESTLQANPSEIGLVPCAPREHRLGGRQGHEARGSETTHQRQSRKKAAHQLVIERATLNG